jgi:hypothetical protein
MGNRGVELVRLGKRGWKLKLEFYLTAARSSIDDCNYNQIKSCECDVTTGE